MAKIFVLCILAALVVIASSKSLSHEEATCYDCTNAVGAGEVHKRQKRDRNAPEVINSVTGLLRGILEPTWDGIARVNRIKMRANQTRVYNIGTGHNNVNHVMFNSGGSLMKRRRPSYGYDNQNSGNNINSLRPSFNYRSQGNNYLSDSYDDVDRGGNGNSLRPSFNYRTQGNNYLSDSYGDDDRGGNVNSLRPSSSIGNLRGDYYDYYYDDYY